MEGALHAHQHMVSHSQIDEQQQPPRCAPLPIPCALLGAAGMRTCGWLASEPSSGDTRSSQFVPSPDGLSLVPACSLVKVRIKSSCSVDFLEGARRERARFLGCCTLDAREAPS